MPSGEKGEFGLLAGLSQLKVSDDDGCSRF
jgi:hypothetical protein